jgi:hypothetical protein
MALDIASLVDPTCGLRDYDRIVPIKPTNAGESQENYDRGIEDQKKQRGEVIRCAYFSAAIGLTIITIIIIIMLFVSKTENKVIIILGLLLFAGLGVFGSGFIAGRKYDIEQTVFNDIYKDTNWNKEEAHRLYNQRKQAELERQAKMDAARMQANAFQHKSY